MISISFQCFKRWLVLIFRGSWDGHKPMLVSERFARLLRKVGYEVAIESRLEKRELMRNLIVPGVLED